MICYMKVFSFLVYYSSRSISYTMRHTFIIFYYSSPLMCFQGVVNRSNRLNHFTKPNQTKPNHNIPSRKSILYNHVINFLITLKTKNSLCRRYFKNLTSNFVELMLKNKVTGQIFEIPHA